MVKTERTLSIDLAEMTDGGLVTNLSGRPRGLAARNKYALDWASIDDAKHFAVNVPEGVDSIAPSFFQGMFGAAFAALNKDRDLFYDYFEFKVEHFLRPQIEQGVAALQISRNLDDLM